MNIPSPITIFAPVATSGFFSFDKSVSGTVFGTTLASKNAVTKYPIIDAGNKNKKSTNVPFPAVQAIRVVISPNGDQAPPAFAATTILIAPGTKKAFFFCSIVINTVDKISAVVKLSAIGDIKNAKNPVIQNNCLYVYPFEIRLYFNFSNTPICIIVSIYVIATNKKKKISAISSIKCCA